MKHSKIELNEHKKNTAHINVVRFQRKVYDYHILQDSVPQYVKVLNDFVS